MEFIPQLVVTGAFLLTPEVQLGERVSEDKLVELYSEIRKAGFPYQALQLEADGSGATMQAQPPGEVATIKPPLVQIQSVLREGTTETAAKKAAKIMEIASAVLGVGQIFNLGIRVIYNSPLPTNDARDFMLHRVLSFGGEHLDELKLGGDFWGGVKYVAGRPDGGTYTFNIEPTVADQMKSLYVEIDAQFPGTHAPADILDRANDVREYVHGPIGSYLDKIAGDKEQ